jgi:hypothetical protein
MPLYSHTERDDLDEDEEEEYDGESPIFKLSSELIPGLIDCFPTDDDYDPMSAEAREGIFPPTPSASGERSKSRSSSRLDVPGSSKSKKPNNGPKSQFIGGGTKAMAGRPWLFGQNPGMRGGGLYSTDKEYDEYDGPDPDANFFKIDTMRMDNSDSDEEPVVGGSKGSLSRKSSGKRRTLEEITEPAPGRKYEDVQAFSPPDFLPTEQGKPAMSAQQEYSTRVGGLHAKRRISDEPVPLLATPSSDEGRERLEWQTMLVSVLEGEILKGEKSRIGGERSTSETYKKELGMAFWWEIRAKLRGRSDMEEKRRVKERKDRMVDAILEEVDRFAVSVPEDVLQKETEVFQEETELVKTAGVNSEELIEVEERAAEVAMTADQHAMLQVLNILNKLSLAESLYPNRMAMMLEKPLYKEGKFQARVDAMSSWATNARLVQAIVTRLRQWTGSSDLDVTKPNTNHEKPLVNHGGRSAREQDAKARIEAADDSTFIERTLKEVSIEKLFEKKTLTDLYTIVKNIKLSIIAHHAQLNEVGLREISHSTFHPQVILLVSFPCRLVVAALRVRLEAAAKLVDPSPIVINDMLHNMRMTLGTACRVKYEYTRTFQSDPAGAWQIPHCIGDDFDDVLLESLRTFFMILQWKLRSGGKAIYFRETEVLDHEWDFLYKIADDVEGGDVLVAELFW